MRLQLATLAEKATVRDGLLFMLGACVTILGREAWPAPMALDLALGFVSDDVADAGGSHTVTVVVKSAVRDQTFMSATFGWDTVELAPGLQPDEPVSLPVVISLQGVGLPGAGHYRVVVTFDNEEAGVLPFTARSTASTNG